MGHRLVSSYNAAIDLGRCWIFLIICTFSRMILGFHVGFKSEDWMSVMLGYESMAMDKVSLSAKYGKHISEEQWPVECISDEFLFDGGRLDSYDTDGLRQMNVATEAGVRVYPWARAIMESINNKLKQRLSSYLGPTHSEKFDDLEAEAKVDKKTYIGILIECILEHNREPMKDYPLTQQLRENNVPRVPIEIWNYGRKKMRQPRKVPLSIVRFNLLPMKKARVHPTHVEFRGLKFELRGTKEQKDSFYGLALLKKCRKYYDIDVKFNPSLVDHIYAFKKGNIVHIFATVQKIRSLCVGQWAGLWAIGN